MKVDRLKRSNRASDCWKGLLKKVGLINSGQTQGLPLQEFMRLVGAGLVSALVICDFFNSPWKQSVLKSALKSVLMHCRCLHSVVDLREN